MLEQMKERDFEDDICAWLCTHGGYLFASAAQSSFTASR